MDGHIGYLVWGGVALLVIVLAVIVGPWIFEAWQNRNEPDTGATEEWVDPDTGELGQIIKEVSFDRTAPLTEEIDMEALHTKLALEDVQIWLTKASRTVFDSAIETLLDDDKWQKYLTPGRHSKKDV